MQKMDKKIQIHCPLYTVGHEDISQIVHAGIESSDRCAYIDLPWNGKGWHTTGWKPPITTDCGADLLLLHGNMHLDKAKEIKNNYPKLPCIVLDYKDCPNTLFTKFPNDSTVTYFKRSMVKMHSGVPEGISEFPGYNVHHSAFCVREDIVEAASKYNNLKRDIDVSCFFEKTWYPNNVKTINDIHKVGQFKDHRKVNDFWPYYKDHNGNNLSRGYAPIIVDIIPKLKKHIGKTAKLTQGDGRKGVGLLEEGSMQNNYLKLMLRSKIVVTSCPANYEGDYRLMEAMACGSLVLHNRMLLPPSGLIDGEHWVIYDSPLDLLQKIIFYNNNPRIAKEIALAGKQYVLNNHMPRNRVEEWLRTTKLI
jgi:hypothetical protein